MADNCALQTATGGRDDLQIDSSRCMRMRFSESSCRRCAAVCPHGAISLEGVLSVNPSHCTGCLLCTAVCPSGALEQRKDFSTCLTQLAGVPEPILGCIRTKDRSHAALACLGGLSEEHLVTAYHSLTGKLTLNLSACSGCPNSTIIPELEKRLTAIAEAGLSGINCRIELAIAAHDIRYRDETVDRRSFFKAFRNSVIKSAAVVLSTTIEQAELRTEYAVKRTPARRELLNRTRSKLSQELEVRIRQHFDSRLQIDHSCTSCQGCVAICPTGALQTVQTEIPPTVNPELCTGCGLCCEFCLDGALQVYRSTA